HGDDNDPEILAQRAELAYGAQLILYPAPDGDHSALAALLADQADDRFPPVTELAADAARARRPPETGRGAPELPVQWTPPPDPVGHFAGRAEELARLDRWAADPQIALIGVTAW